MLNSPRHRAAIAAELLMVLVILAVIAIAVFVPVLNKARTGSQVRSSSGERQRRATCNSNVRQLSVAIQMYVQDNNNQYPGIDGSSWVSKISSYLGGSSAMFQCPSDTVRDSGSVSYAYAGFLIRQDGTGIKESAVISPSEVGCVADASPSELYPNGRLIGGGGQQPIEQVGALIDPRHSKGAIVGFCDGHAKYYQGIINTMDEGSGAVRALYHASPLGLVDNPLACVGADAGITGSGKLTVGGEYVTRPLLLAAAQMYGAYSTPGFNGQNSTAGRPSRNRVWGAVSGAKGPSSPAIAYDALLFIVAKGSRIPSLPSLSNQTYAVDIGFLHQAFTQGYVANSVQVYHMNTAASATDAYARSIAKVTRYGKGAIQVKNDLEMVEKVANDPYGIGYCSSAFADPDRVTILAPVIAGATYVWPRSSKKFRWVMPTRQESTWPWKRSINVVTSKKPSALESSITSALRGGELSENLATGPLFTWGYWPGDY